MLTQYQQQLRARHLSAPITTPPEPWGRQGRPGQVLAVGGLFGVGFGVHPETGTDLLMAASWSGFGLIEAATGTKIARDYEDAPDLVTPAGPDLACPGIGVLAGTRVRMAGLFGGGLHTTTEDGWFVEVVAPEWPCYRVVLSAPGGRGLDTGEPGTTWWSIFSTEGAGELRAAGFSHQAARWPSPPLAM